MNTVNLFTPYIRNVSPEYWQSTRGVHDNTDRYKLFALRTQIFPLLNEGEEAVYRRILLNGGMRMVMNVMLGGEVMELPVHRRDELQEFIDKFFSSGSNDCLLMIINKDDSSKVLTWPFPENINVYVKHGMLFADLSKVENYSEVYDDMNIGIYYSLI